MNSTDFSGSDRPALEQAKRPEEDVRKARKQFFVIMAVAGVLIVALAISIIVVAINKNKPEPVKEPEASVEKPSDEGERAGYVLTDEELDEIYRADVNEIAVAVLNASENGEGMDGILAMYLEKIAKAEDVRLKAMLESDYYFLRFSLTPTDEVKNEILNALMRIDGVLETPASAYNVVNIASFYNEQEMVNYYTNLAMERSEIDVGETEDEDDIETAP